MKPITGIAVDGSTRGNPGPSEYRGVDLLSKKVVFHQKIGFSTNNITEFIALCHAIFLFKNKKTIIYTDSQTALFWLKNKSVTTRLQKNEKTKIAHIYLDRCLSKLEEINIYDDGNYLRINDLKISKWLTSKWGETPADFNLK